MLLEVEARQVISASPQRSHPLSRGTLCTKGWNGHQIIHHPQRLTQPLIRDRKTLKPATWRQALTLISKRFAELRNQHGAESLGIIGSVKMTTEEAYLLNRFARSVLGTPHIDTLVRYDHAPSVRVLQEQTGYATATAGILDIEKASVLLIIGANPKAQTARIGSYIFQAAKRGVPVIQIDPRQQEHSAFYAHFLQPRPGTDLTLINAMLQVILANGWQDAGVLGVSHLRDDGLQRFTPEYAETVCGVPADKIIQVAEVFAKSGPGIILYGTGITQQANATAHVQALWNLALLTGNINREGAGLIPLLNANNSQGIIDAGLMTELAPGHRLIQSNETRHALKKQWSALPEKRGYTIQEMLRHAGGKLRGLYLVGENLAWAAPDAQAAVKALQRLDFLVVQDLFLTETAELADVLLPACSFAEKEGTFTNLEGRIQRVHRAIPPLGESLPDGEIFCRLARAFGAPFPAYDPKLIFQEMQSIMPCYEKITYAQLDHPGGVVWPAHAAAGDGRCRTLMGERRGALVPATAGAPFAEPPDEEYPFTLFTGRPVFHRRSGTLVSRSFTLDKEDAVQTVEISTDDAKTLKLRSGWPVWVVTRRGKLRCTLSATRAVAPGTLFLPIHHKSGPTQALMPATMENESGIPEMKLCAAKLETA